MPSRVRYPCNAPETALRGRPASQTTVRRRQRPRTSAAFNPAGPPPTMITSKGSMRMRAAVGRIPAQAVVAERNRPLRDQLPVLLADGPDPPVQIEESEL